MRSTIALSFLIALSCGAVFGQNADRAVEQIRAIYNDVSPKAAACESDEEQGQYGPLVMNELSINAREHQWRAIGIYGKIVRYFYRGGDSEKHLYPDQLVFIKSVRRESNRSYSEEFLFSDAGKLIFYFQRAENDELSPAERRIYFADGRAIRMVEDGRSRDRLGKGDRAAADAAAGLARELKYLFERSIKL